MDKSNLNLLLSNMQLLVLDFDGVLTSNTVYLTEDGVESVRCWRGDGMGISLLNGQGVKTWVVSKEVNKVVAKRCEKLKINCIQGCDDKENALLKISKEQGISTNNIAFMGNDINDIPALQLVGLPIVVADAHPETLLYAKYQTSTKGGYGAVREICDMIVAAKHKHETVCSH